MGAARWARKRAEANYGDERGVTYLIHLNEPYQHARHYTGWGAARSWGNRVRDELAGNSHAARLMQVVKAAGIDARLAWIWPETTRDREDQLKHRGGASRHCPECGHTPTTGCPPPEILPLSEPRKLTCYDLERLGTWLDGTPVEPEIEDDEFEIGA